MEKWIIKANIIQDKVFRDGAKILILDIPGSKESLQVRGMSKGGRIVTKWVQMNRLKNFRPEYAAELDDIGFGHFIPKDKEHAQEVAGNLEKCAEEKRDGGFERVSEAGYPTWDGGSP